MSMMDRIKLNVSNLDLYYGEKQALKKINMDIKANKVTALIGPSGCGKSTFLRTLNRMNDLIDNVKIEGTVEVDGEDIYKNRREKEFKVNVTENKQETTNSQNNQENNVNKIESENNKPNEDITISQSNEKNNVKDHLDNDHQQTKPPQTVYWYECYLCGLYVDSNVSLEDAKKKFDQTKCTDAIEFSGIEWRHSRFHYGINHS